ncbi:NACHT, LRR and PYD domains-containing protein 3-like isoform X2 [Hemicordylus capensis]|uniref:NACHT, LRR and PYD domains-containing protein 3-like isoform X2 n=1 Tax=Hemicordylus capensis TaxID=884348 RepID=UPI002304B19D|nr:NACHT, LRR and PYD domains-containing protein 3-like isoform X2 [Hemicordylus capensis]
MPPIFPDYREKYRDCVRKKYQTPEDGNACHRAHLYLNERCTKLISANVKEGEHDILNRPWRHTGIISEQTAAITIDSLFGEDTDRAQTAVLLGAAGVGKTTMARKILLDWAAGRLFPDRFDSVFYLSCRQMNLVVGQTSLADLSLNSHPEFTQKEAQQELLMSPGRLLFIVDGFDELNCSTEQEEGNLSTDPHERKPVGILLSSLFQKTLLPEACLIITTRPNALGNLEKCLQSPCYVELLGFSEEGKEEYFHKFFGDKALATQALNYVKGNEAFWTACFVPSACWLICTVMKQQLSGREDLVPMCENLTAVYALSLSHLLTESPCNRSEQQNVRGFCSLAADGILQKRALFKEDEIRKQGLDPLSSTLCEHLFQKDPDCSGIYSFIHFSLQEFLAALFCLFEDGPEDSQTTKQDINVLLESCHKDQGDVTLIVQFICGLLNREIMQYIKDQFGWKISSAVKTNVLEWLKGDTQKTLAYPNYDQLELFHALYENHEEEFVRSALAHLTEITMDRLKFTPMDQAVLSFCIKNCLNLEALSLYTCVFLSKDHEAEELLGLSSWSSQLDGCKLTDSCCADLSTVLSTCQMLVNLSLQMSNLKDSGVRLLCEGLSHPNCKLEKLELWDCDLTHAGCRDLAVLLGTSQALTELKLSENSLLGDQGVELLCQGLKHPDCTLQSLGLEDCKLTAPGCQALASVLGTSQMLTKLHLGNNGLGDAGVKLLCEGLKHPKCKLQTLSLATCELTSACCGDLSSVLSVSQTLTELVLEYNKLEDTGVRLLCEGLKQPNCKLQILGLGQCNATAACCGDLASIFATNQALMELVVEFNPLGDSGVTLLCQGLKHPRCKLQTLNLYNCDLSAACGGDLASVLCSSQTLTELLLGGNSLGDLGMKLLCEGLKHPNCKLQKLCLCESEITAASCGELSSALSTNQMLEDIDLWNNQLGDSGARLLFEGLKQPTCKLQILSMCNCKLTAASCGDISSALCTNQNLKELRLDANELGDSGVMLLCQGLKHPNCRLKKIGLDSDQLTAKTVRMLSALKKMKPDLLIDI